MTVAAQGSSHFLGVAGPAKGSCFPLDRPELVIGRDPGSGILLPDPAVSPRHGVVRRRGELVTVAALGPDRPVFVNGLPVVTSPRRLSTGDQVSVGGSVLLFARSDAEAGSGVVLAGGAGPLEVVWTLGRDEAMRLTDDASGAAALPASLLASLLRIGTAISAIRGLVALRAPLLTLLLDTLPADRAALVIVSDPDVIASVTAVDRVHGTDTIMQADGDLIQQSVADGVARLARRGPRTRTGARDPSGHVAIAPMVAFDRVVGALYLDVDGPAARLTPVHLQAALLVAGLAAVALDSARSRDRLEQENEGLRVAVEVEQAEHDMVGTSAGMRAVYQRIARVAPTDSTVLICGESGTGKELIARALHRNSRRSRQAFVAINCAALAETLLESEMFGHEKGAFTGAVAQKKGRLELADGGTVFLDEVGELPIALQAKVLRALQEREFERVGGTRPVRVDVRIVAATNRDLQAAIRDGTFRRDLYYRLDVVSLQVPPLRERGDDIPLLARYFARKHGAAIRHRPVTIAPAAIACLRRHDWPGNVRELENVIERAVVLGSGETIGPGDLGELGDRPLGAVEAGLGDADGGSALAYHDALAGVKRSLVLRALQQADGNFTAAARLLGLHPNYLHRLIRNLGLRPMLRRFGVHEE